MERRRVCPVEEVGTYDLCARARQQKSDAEGKLTHGGKGAASRAASSAMLWGLVSGATYARQRGHAYNPVNQESDEISAFTLGRKNNSRASGWKWLDNATAPLAP